MRAGLRVLLDAHDRAQLVVFAYQSGLLASGRASWEAA